MVGWIHISLVVASAGIFLLLFLFFHCFCHTKQPEPVAGPPSIQNGISKLHHQDNAFNNKRRTNYYVSRRGLSSKPLFNWSDNPSLIADAVENGWSQFAFTDYASSLSVRSNRFLLGSCASSGDGSGGDAEEVEISWEVCQGSADFMQKIHLNSGLKKMASSTSSSMAAGSVIKSALPLPGPALGNSSPFPQEAYFEITILSICENENGIDSDGKARLNTGEGENIKLIQEHGEMHANCEESNDRTSVSKDTVEGKNEVFIMLSVGLTGGGSLPVKLPGSYPGSVGFNSDGSIYLDGVKLITELEIERWERNEKVIGCGYNPSQKKVFFTIDSKLVQEIHCKTEEYGTPLYPTLAANSDIMVLVNFGQSIFKYAPANSQRTQNPCFVGPMANSSSSGYEDSKEFFSMGRIDSQWLNRPTTRSGQYNLNVNKGKTKDYDEASEGDLFEIVLDSNSYRKSPGTPF
ncbi:uncharacterized protein LOC112501629 [Cynara cardunculus var. scolymus]|uniref:B30.2/SPRY domain-containing protein n=1 Tax=Cynara cardunculus var. scolymus TaxID=59895 RepID=A0A124SAW8_CYNCS|nr:uncharacterized protein LOC112501629 [Cynara cardunculus var. scolymus]KVH88825.1 hypothetical protein Ccrd_025345 [Cynara cardunculus var. scolymus]